MQATPNRIGSRLIRLQQVDSTNNYATGLVHAGMAQHGDAVITHAQTKGKGQRNRSWESASGENITLSLIIDPKMHLRDAFLLSMSVAVGVRNFLNSLTNVGAIKIKWPNDIYWNDRKAGGILIENVISGDLWKYAIAGIGLNINQEDFGALNEKAVSLKQITKQDHDIYKLAEQLCAFIEESYKQLHLNPDQIIAGYHEHLYKVEEDVSFRKDNRVFTATVKKVSSQGALILQHGIEERYMVGDIEWII